MPDDWFCNNFTHDEMKCPCCHQEAMNPKFMRRLQRAREIAGVPFDIKNGSGWRCQDHNSQVGGAPESSHVTGRAADIPAIDSKLRFHIINGLIKAGFNRIGIASKFIHVDDSEAKPQRLTWLY